MYATSCAELEIAGIMPVPQSTRKHPVNHASNGAIASGFSQTECGLKTLIELPRRTCILFAILLLSCFSLGCNFIPDVRHKAQYHNPFPQLSTVAVLPFRNQSEDPTLDSSRVTLAYYNELQSIPGFEVLPVGVVESQLAGFEQQVLQRPLSNQHDIQQFAKYLGVDAVLQGAVTDYEAYYPPRITLKVNWYAANEGFHPIPVGYGLPWGTKDEKKIPESIRLESERTLAREQLNTQTPVVNAVSPSEPQPTQPEKIEAAPTEEPVKTASYEVNAVADRQIKIPSELEPLNESIVAEPIPMDSIDAIELGQPGPDADVSHASPLPIDWPDPQGFIPPPPKSIRPVAKAQSLPIISHMRTYNGHDEDFTQQLSEYYYFRDDARFGGWEAYLQRSEDFIRFCCHSHIVETLAARGGQLKSRTVVRWPINRYER
jgi:hypothetical protein